MGKSTLDPSRYQKVPGDPAFPPPSRKREEEYIERMMRRDSSYERRDTTVPNQKKVNK